MRLEADLEKQRVIFWCYCYVTWQLHDKHCKNELVYESSYLYKLCHVTLNICNEFPKERLFVSAWTKGTVGNTDGPWVTKWKKGVSSVLRGPFCPSAQTKDPPPFQQNSLLEGLLFEDVLSWIIVHECLFPRKNICLFSIPTLQLKS